MDFMQEYEKWLHSPALSPEEHAELESIKDDPKEIESRFFGPLEFGTAGLRGTMYTGLHNMNIHVIRWATQGFADVIAAEGEEGKRRGVAICMDCRNHSMEFARAAAEVCAAACGRVHDPDLIARLDHVVLEALRGNPEQLHDHLSYLTRTKDGKILKSTTIYIRDDDGAPIGIFGINYDITLMLAMENAIKQFTATEKDEKEPEPIARNVSDLLDELIEQSVKVVGKPVALMNKEDKVKAVQFLNETGAFLITKSGDRVCKFFGISKYTLYSYIDESKA